MKLNALIAVLSLAAPLAQGTLGYFCMRCHAPVATTLKHPRWASIADGPPLLPTVTDVAYSQPLASLTVMVWVPTDRLVKLVVLPNEPPSIAYSYGAEPPVTSLILIEPLLAPHAASVGLASIADGPPLVPINTVLEKVQPLSSLTSIVCEPTDTPLYVVFPEKLPLSIE